MSDRLNRRELLFALGAGSAELMIGSSNLAAASVSASRKPIAGSWFEFQHHATVESVDWNPALVRFTADQWQAKIKEIADAGLEVLVLMSTAVYYRTFFDTAIYPKWQLACDDPLEAVLSAADKYKIKFFIGVGFYGNWQSGKTIVDPVANKYRLQSLGELAARYGHHPSFHGWYWPDEAEINPYYSPEFVAYVNTLSNEARRLNPNAPVMIAPYGTRIASPDDKYVRQLDAMDVDIVAYQDEVGVRKSNTTETSAFYEGLRKAHDRSQKAKIWADLEIFEFQEEVYNSALMPAPFERVQRQLEAVSPWVDEILVYQYLGMMNAPGTTAFAGAPASTRLYTDYQHWLKSL
ncbi:MAG: DUF4434 domain-containing protein [Terracidiphilus sp.]